MEKKFTETAYVICHNEADIIHPMKVEAGTCLTSGQPEYEEFATEEEWKARLDELGYKSELPLNLDASYSPSSLENLPAALRGARGDRADMRAIRATLAAAKGSDEMKAARKEIRESLKADRQALRAAKSPEERKMLRQGLKVKRNEALANLAAKVSAPSNG